MSEGGLLFRLYGMGRPSRACVLDLAGQSSLFAWCSWTLEIAYGSACPCTPCGTHTTRDDGGSRCPCLLVRKRGQELFPELQQVRQAGPNPTRCARAPFVLSCHESGVCVESACCYPACMGRLLPRQGFRCAAIVFERQYGWPCVLSGSTSFASASTHIVSCI